MEIKRGELRKVQYRDQARVVKVIRSIDERPGYWLVEDVFNKIRFDLPVSEFDPALLEETPEGEMLEDGGPEP
ncbi:MAG TPA: hypothetical protein VMV69_14865 [Pirellulales bacterium]|nr:hypothetical protein [Pirellulales bacterium]